MPIESAKKKIEEEAKACGSLEKAIARHLIEIMDEELAALVNRPDYTLKEMGAFVIGKAKKELNGKSGALEGEVVFGFATDYYHASRKEIQGTAASASMTSVKASADKKTAQAPKQAAKAQEQGKNAQKTAQNAQEKPKVLKPAKNAAPEGQLSLFDLMGGFANA